MAASKSIVSGNRIRLWPTVLVIGVAALLLAWIRLEIIAFTRRPLLDMFFVLPPLELGIYFTVRICSGALLRTQILILVGLFGLQGIAWGAIRVDGLMGNGQPIFVWRWQSSDWSDSLLSQEIGSSGRKTDLRSWSELDYPGFRGRSRDGVITGVQLFHDWKSRPPRLLWRTSIGGGWSSFALIGEFCVTQEQRGENEVVVCYSLDTGAECWAHADAANFVELSGGGGPRATPTIDQGRVYALGATGILNCLDGSNGQVVWCRNILQDANAENCLFGMVGSPLVVDSLVIVCPGGREASVVAYDKQSGAQIWQGGNSRSSYSSPMIAKLSGGMQVLNFNADGLFAHDLKSGKVLWEFPWVSNPEERNNVCQPILIPRDDLVNNDQWFLSSGYGRGSALLEIKRAADTFRVRPVWSNRNLKSKFASAVLHESHIFGLDDGILVCLDVHRGERCWKGGRYGHGQLILVDDLLLIQAESGEVVLVEANPDRFQELGRFDALGDKTWNHPAIRGSRLLVRNDREAACFELPIERAK